MRRPPQCSPDPLNFGSLRRVPMEEPPQPSEAVPADRATDTGTVRRRKQPPAQPGSPARPLRPPPGPQRRRFKGLHRLPRERRNLGPIDRTVDSRRCDHLLFGTAAVRQPHNPVHPVPTLPEPLQVAAPHRPPTGGRKMSAKDSPVGPQPNASSPYSQLTPQKHTKGGVRREGPRLFRGKPLLCDP